MRTLMLGPLLAACCVSAAGGADRTPAPASVEARVATQNSLFEEYYQSELKAHPERATAYGDYRYNDRLDEHSLAAINSQHANDVSFLARLDALPPTGCSEQDTLSQQVLRSTLQQRLDNYGFKEY